ncbi:EVE domain-containing protein [Azospirillum oryzae]|uniref:EVE domain-containing protein n=1 Tax=Azospirillum oryzae TaxID=286727 RepID=A0A6N1AJ10_9PROT|nr:MULTISPECIES: EVE domain-containing protein [Azospirillum]KAA0583845.1 EVE domain-containing protein [Azospirillum sp. B21]KAA0589467.1 EVE domain-containing protein [Azospirillum oryzae]QKS51309.1 EVE domain-containing protein [Azospirillum oryzae]GLR82164.1 ubiquinol-cytochrome c reductase [Azospirillum oryzae]
MAYWLVKSEPFKYSWDRMVADGRTHWDGVRNYQASNNLKAMEVGDRAFFYHSNEGLEIVGIVEIVRTYYPDPSDESGRFGMVDVAPVMPVKTPVTLKQIKADPLLQSMALVRQSRLSVCPVSDEEWARVCDLAGVGVPA